MSFVIDTSVLMPILLPDERDDRAINMLRRFSNYVPHAPILLKYEVMNVLIMAERKGRITSQYRLDAISQFKRIPIQFDLMTGPDAWQSLADLAARHRLTGYDASYLALALDRGLPLATFDKEIIAAARTLSVPLF